MAHYLLVRDAEPLPITPGAKKLRMAMLADALLQRGHQVTWFCSTFNHMKKELYFNVDKTVELSDHYRLVLKHAGRYNSNISFARIRHHRRLARRLAAYLRSSGNLFDVIVVSHPIVELACEAVKFANKQSVPVVVDVRDKWPETFQDYVPKVLRPVVRLATLSLRRRTKRTFQQATKLVSMSHYMTGWAETYSNRQGGSSVFHLGTSLEGGQKPCSNKTQGDAPAMVCTYVGGLINSYDLALLMQAANVVDGNTVFRVVGDGPKRAALEAMPLNNNVVFLGWCDSEGVSCQLHSADVLCFPVGKNVSPNMPNKLFDYLWAGKPILASVYGEAADLIREHKLGYVFKHGDLKDFLRGLSYLSDPDIRAEISENIKRIYKEKYSARKIYGAYADLLESIL
jgi:glycosyltransferase involved in cell wall biosynthesis